ncbi:hypothetical protein XENOCAPTIV_016038 [Xenoophorus captivus]|uniref:Secreted protein n=1 Tax=Xenoophorus captivus TaxID=1517983 RepID=A0ABV0QIJ5_9TELE
MEPQCPKQCARCTNLFLLLFLITGIQSLEGFWYKCQNYVTTCLSGQLEKCQLDRRVKKRSTAFRSTSFTHKHTHKKAETRQLQQFNSFHMPSLIALAMAFK